jgi:hypothetical protein
MQKIGGAAGITTAAPRIAGQWGRGDNRLRKRRAGLRIVPARSLFFEIFSRPIFVSEMAYFEKPWAFDRVDE